MIYTNRFELVELTRKYASDRYLSWLNGDASTYLTNTKTDKEGLIEYIEYYLNNKNTYLLGIFTKDSEEHIGNVKFEYLDENKHTVGLGILIGDPNYRGKGVAKEVIQGIADFVKIHSSTKLIVLGVSKNNKPAISAYTKLGFKLEARPFYEINSEDGVLMSWSLVDS
jgi:RimJ/RimL family protein N-acetyltransferase